jgi:dipeptidyl aminopeptidase/acylaminoacyl peptidase
MRLLSALAAVSLALCASPGLARPFTVEDLLATEGVDGGAFDPSGRWAVIARTAPWPSAPAFDQGGRTGLGLGRLDIIDLERPGQAEPLFPHEPGAGYMAGPFSPSGRQMLVFGLKDRAWRAGVADLAGRSVRWLSLAPELPVYGRVAAWRSDEELLLITRSDGRAPRQLRVGWSASAQLPGLWAAQAAGAQATATVRGSGRYLGPVAAGGGAQLVSLNLRTGHRALLAGGEILDFEPSPNGRHLALFAAAEPRQPRTHERVYAGFPSHRRSLRILDFASGHVTEPCEGCDFHLRLLSWSPSGQELLVAERPPATPDAARLLEIAAKSGAMRRLDLKGLELAATYNGEMTPLFAASWMGAEPIVYARKGDGRSDWFRLAGSGPVNLTAQLPHAPRRIDMISASHLGVALPTGAWKVDRNGGARRIASNAEPVVPEGLREGSRFLVNPQPGGQPMIVRSPGPEGDRLVELSPRRRIIGPADDGQRLLAVHGARALLAHRTPQGVTTIEVVEGSRPASGPALTLNAGLAGVTPARLMAVPHKGPQGQALNSWLYLPRPFPDGPKPALVVIPYPGEVNRDPPRSSLPGALRLPTNPQVLAGAGYAVLIPSLPFDRTLSEPMAGLADQILAVVDAAVASGEVDGERIALFGHSFGGYTAMAAATQTQRFKAIIAMAGISDLVSYWGITPLHHQADPAGSPLQAVMSGLAEQGHSYQGTPPWVDPGRYVRNSPIFAADKVSTPILFIHGDQDEVTPNQSEEMFSALYRQGKDAQLVSYWGEGHAVVSPANVRDLYARVLRFLAENLDP